jgi:hypothetical protein
MTPFKYAGFWDFPRCIKLRYRDQYFLLDGPFDEDLDEYPDIYSVYLVSESIGTMPWHDLFPLDLSEVRPYRASVDQTGCFR